MAEGLSASEVGKEIAEHREHTAGEHAGAEHRRHDRLISIAEESQATHLSAQADAYSSEGESAAGTADKYVRLTVLLAAVLFLVGIGSRFPLRSARIGLVVVAAVLLLVSVVQLLSLRGPPA